MTRLKNDGAAPALAGDIQEAIDEHTGSDDDEDVDEEDELDDDLKDEDMENDKACSKPVRKTFPIFKELGDQQIIYGVVSEPDTIDLQGDRLSKAEIRKACHRFMIESQQIGKRAQRSCQSGHNRVQHSFSGIQMQRPGRAKRVLGIGCEGLRPRPLAGSQIWRDHGILYCWPRQSHTFLSSVLKL